MPDRGDTKGATPEVFGLCIHVAFMKVSLTVYQEASKRKNKKHQNYKVNNFHYLLSKFYSSSPLFFSIFDKQKTHVS
jgi:hypothetical protein